MMLAKSLQSAAGNAAAEANYIEDVFSTWLYTGNGYPNTTPNVINNGIDLAGEGGLVWIKNRLQPDSHVLSDSARGKPSGSLAYKWLQSNLTDAERVFPSYGITSFNADGFTLDDPLVQTYQDNTNRNGETYASWTFRKQPKFFDVVTYTGNGTSQNIAHSLGSVPGCIIIKRIDSTSNWIVYHRGLSNPFERYGILNSLSGTPSTNSTVWNNTNPTSTEFSLGTSGLVNTNGGTYVAYIFAHNSGGFGLTGTDNVISCGSFTTSGSSATVDLGYEPQWVMIKDCANNQFYQIYDNMRGLTSSVSQSVQLSAGSSSAETNNPVLAINATGFSITQYADTDYIYIAIRRGPMKVPESGTSVFAPVTATAPSSPYTVTTNFPVDLTINATRNSSSGKSFNDRLRGGTTNSYVALDSTNTSAEAVGTGFGIGFQSNTSIVDNGWQSGTGNNPIYWNFRRAPGFFDEVCYTGTGVAKTESHNLGVAPELMIVKSRAGTGRDWAVYIAPMGNNYFACLNDGSFQGSSSAFWNDTTPTSSVFTVGTNLRTNNSGQTYVAYLFASCPGVSKVGSYTGTGTTQQINCGFTAGARFVLIKRTDSTGDWYVWDTARGIVAGNDPYLLLNSTAAEVTSADYIDPVSSGFEISSTAPAAINASGGSFIFLAIA